MVLLDNVVEVFYLSYNDGNSLVFNDLIDRLFIGVALIHGDFLRNAIVLNGILDKAHGCCFITLCSQQKIDCFAFFIDGTIQIFPDTFYFNVGFIDMRATTHLTFMLSKNFF